MTLIEQGADILKSKIELERGYGKSIGLNDDIPFFPGDGPEIRASAKLAQAAIRYLVNSGQYRPAIYEGLQHVQPSAQRHLALRASWPLDRASNIRTRLPAGSGRSRVAPVPIATPSESAHLPARTPRPGGRPRVIPLASNVVED